MKAVKTLLIIAGLLIIIPLLFIIISAVTYESHQSPAYQELAIRVNDQEAVKLLTERVTQDYHYRELGGHDLRLVALMRPEPEKCRGLWRDYYNNEVVYETCLEGVFTFAANESAPSHVERYTARTWLIGDQVKGFEITEQPRPIIDDYESCVEAGGETLLPDCEDCARSCALDGQTYTEGGEPHV